MNLWRNNVVPVTASRAVLTEYSISLPPGRENRALLLGRMLKERERDAAMGPVGSPVGEPAICAGCGGKIVDRFYLLAVDRQWHSACLKCSECKLPLDSELTCFARDGVIYCKEDYYRLVTSYF